MASGHESLRDGEFETTRVIELAERRAAEARDRAARAGLLAACSFEESALRHESVAKAQDRSVQQRVSDVDKHRESGIVHREFAAEDRKLADLKRKETEADLAFDADH